MRRPSARRSCLYRLNTSPQCLSRFALIDINRIRFCRHLTRNDCVEVFKHLDNLPPPALSVVLVRYAELRQWNPQILCGAVMLRQGVNLPRRIKTGFRSLLSHLGLRK